MSPVTLEEMTRRRDHWRGRHWDAMRRIVDLERELGETERNAVDLLARIAGLEAQVSMLTSQLRASQAEARCHAIEAGLLRDALAHVIEPDEDDA